MYSWASRVTEVLTVDESWGKSELLGRVVEGREAAGREEREVETTGGKAVEVVEAGRIEGSLL